MLGATEIAIVIALLAAGCGTGDREAEHDTTCSFVTEDGQTVLNVDSRRYSIVGNYLVEPELLRAHYHRVRS